MHCARRIIAPRHAQYKTEAELQAAHAIAPWIVVWDDHEVANNAFATGAENHNRRRRRVGQPQARGAAGLLRMDADPRSGTGRARSRRSTARSSSAICFTLIMVETRLLARTQPLDYARELPIEMQRWNFANPDRAGRAARWRAGRAGDADACRRSMKRWAANCGRCSIGGARRAWSRDPQEFAGGLLHRAGRRGAQRAAERAGSRC